jgi:hypothetical protein
MSHNDHLTMRWLFAWDKFGSSATKRLIGLSSTPLKAWRWRTYSFPWREVEGIGTGEVMTLRAVGFVLRSGKVRCAQVTCYDCQLRSTTAERLLLYAPQGVRFIPQK